MSLRTAEAVGRGQSSAPPPNKRRRIPLPILLAAVVVIAVIVLAFLAHSGGTDKSKVSANKTTSSTAGGAASDGLPQAPSIAGADAPGAAGGAGAKGAAGPDDAAARAEKAMADQAKLIPLNVAVSNTKGLKDGDPVTIHVTPKGSVVFGFEAFLCKGGTTYAFDADIRPDDSAKCVAHKLSPNSDDYLQVRTQPPYTSADASFRVGVGTDTFQMTDGSPAAVTCGPSNPCAVVLKLQFPNGFGFEAFPVTYR